MEGLKILAITTFALACLVQSPPVDAGETVLSAVLTPTEEKNEKSLSRQGRSYYDQRYAAGRPLYDRLEYDRSRCGRCLDDRYDDRDDYDRSGRDRYDDDRRVNHRPTYGNRHDRNKNYDNDEDDRRYSTDRRNNQKTNGTDDDNDSDKKRPHDEKDNRPSSSRRGSERDRNKYDDRERYRPDYYDRFLRDRNYERPYYEDPYRERRPLFERYPDRYDDGFGGRYDGYGYPGYRKPLYDDRYDRGIGYDDGYGGYGPGVGRGPHDSFRPWDETYRGQAGWDAGGRGYYFASGRPDSAPAPAWGRPEYARPETTASGWQNVGYSGYRDQLEYRGSFGYPQDYGYRQDLGYGRPSGWQSVRSYRDQSGVNGLDNRSTYGQPTQTGQTYAQGDRQPSVYGQSNNYQQLPNIGANGFQSSTTPGTSYLYQREDEQVTTKRNDETTKTPPQ